MLAMPAPMAEALTFVHYRRITCTPVDLAGDPTGDTLAVVDGVIRQSPEPPIRREGSLTVAVPALATYEDVVALREWLVAGGTLLRIDWTVVLMDRREFTVTVGTLRVEEASTEELDGTLELQVRDMGAAIVDDRFISPYTAAATGTKLDAIEALLTETVDVPVTSTGVPSSAMAAAVTWDTDRDAAVTELATGLGCRWWWAADGSAWVVAPVPVPATSPADWVIPAGSGRITSQGVASRDGVWNAIAVTGQAPDGTDDPPPFAAVYDLDPSSPLRWDGPFGHRPRFYSSPVLTTVAQCELAAATIMAGNPGLTRGFAVQLPANPALEPGDTFAFTDGPAGVFVADTIDLTVAGATMAVTARKVAP